VATATIATGFVKATRHPDNFVASTIHRLALSLFNYPEVATSIQQEPCHNATIGGNILNRMYAEHLAVVSGGVDFYGHDFVLS
jgi:hypothetical protein